MYILNVDCNSSKWGNSSAVRIPNQFLKQLNLEDGAELQIMMTSDNEILLRPAVKPEETKHEEFLKAVLRNTRAILRK